MKMTDETGGTLQLPKMDGVEVKPGVWLIGEPTPVPGTNKLRCLAQVGCALAVVELCLRFRPLTVGET